MSKFEIDLSTNNNISVELCCLECDEIFSTELDITHDQEILPYSSNGVVNCSFCEVPYEYYTMFDSNKFQITFKNSEIKGNLKYSENINWEEYKRSSTLKSKEFYNIQIERLQILLDIKSEEHIIEQSLNRLVFTGVITSLETYLNEVFILIVFRSNETLEKFVSNYEPYKKEKLSFYEIIEKYKTLEVRVKEDLDSFIYHNIPKLIRVFNIFDFELDKFSCIKNISQHIQKRHKLIHRSGLDDDENFMEVSKNDVESLIVDSNLFVQFINKKIEDFCFLTDFDKFSPF